jgi:ATP-dependent RNA helicase DDX3X
MTGWGMAEVAAALPEISPAVFPTQENSESQVKDPKEVGAAQTKNPQEHGWVPKTDYDYSTYMKSTKELAEAEAAAKESAAPGVEVGGWASNAAIYDWDDDFGDVGPRHPELEKQLFGSDNHVRMGIQFEKYLNLIL